ncbi:hypothetical protein A2856_03850 [Candidatus Uhrbacteria bacterium RIFCSPHIGHO2_01_FULL_63_20]|uniref:Uncharacterized protein n=1 Tax=Candidatus Uhrbacteria bacterium RIFCSPHIGHO2_01_FULL_63_20 TaxID=1802385 RepID=A0A1F7TNS7_9BACT|nr:MAG: hypothetical protein A2856_03850 [Candidatus Uhrbacteria bacterium RIFCSPHIGHO2_01_FULL_63_20]
MANLFKMESGKLNNFMTKLAEAGMTAELANKLRNDNSLMKRLVEAVVTKVAIATISRDYVQPKFADLKYDFDWVNDGCAKAEFTPIDRCMDVPREKREMRFDCMFVVRTMSSDAVLADMDRQGMRPAFYEEILEFVKTNPDEQRKQLIETLGSIAQVVDGRSIAPLYEGSCDRRLGLYWTVYVDVLCSFYVFLVVRK